MPAKAGSKKKMKVKARRKPRPGNLPHSDCVPPKKKTAKKKK